MNRKNEKAWQLESFLDSLILELDKAQETLAIKGMSRPLTYTVKDVALDLHIFPEFNGDKISFINAKPGEVGASKISMQLGSITDRQIRQITKKPVSKDDLAIEDVPDLDADTKKTLRKIGLTSVKDIEELEQRNIDLTNIPKIKKAAKNYKSLSERLKKAKKQQQFRARMFSRQQQVPNVHRIKMKRKKGMVQIDLSGSNLFVSDTYEPKAKVNGQFVKVTTKSADKLSLLMPGKLIAWGNNELKIKLDPFAIIQLNVKNKSLNNET